MSAPSIEPDTGAPPQRQMRMVVTDDEGDGHVTVWDEVPPTTPTAHADVAALVRSNLAPIFTNGGLLGLTLDDGTHRILPTGRVAFIDVELREVPEDERTA